VVKGKYAYMSPEQLSNRALDHRSDLFSLGIVLYEVAAARPLFKRDSIKSTINATSQAQVPALSKVVPGFPSGLERIIHKLLEKDPDARYQSARELHTDLEKFRAAQNWTSGAREIASIMTTLFPPDGLKGRGTGTAVPGSVGAEGSPKTPGAASVRQMEDPWAEKAEGFASAELVDVTETERGAGREGFPWLVAVAAGIATLGSIVFWYLVG
jgi:eukaryotic-like serine/threonine-protein kinase